VTSRRDLERLNEAAEEAEAEASVAKAFREKLRGQKTNRELRAVIKELANQLDMEQRARECLLTLKDSKPYRFKKHRGRGGKNAAVTVACLSDIHLDELVDPADVNGRNEHTPEICDAKLQRYAMGVIKLVAKEQTFHDVERHIQWIGGDLFTGHIHEECIEATAMAPLEAADWIHIRLRALLQHLAENLDVREIVVPWSFGNHGRDGRKPRITKAAQHNFEYLLAKSLEREIAREPWGKKIKFIIETGYLTYLDLGGYTICFHHGDGLSGGGGAGGLSGPINRAVKGWNEHRHADLYVSGHLHQVFDAIHFVANGSLIGMNQFAVRIKARPEPAQQAFFTIDLDRRQKVSFSLIHVLSSKELEKYGWL